MSLFRHYKQFALREEICHIILNIVERGHFCERVKKKLQTSKPLTKWRSGPLFPSLPQTTSLNIYDLRAASSESRLSIISLVGLVNRGAERIYLVQNDDDEFWLKEIDPALPRVDNGLKVGDDLLSHLLTVYRQQVKGLVIYDPRLADTVNVATTLAGLRDGLVVSPDQADKLQADPYRLPVLSDLRKYAWKTPLQAYAWAYAQLLPECSHELVAGLDPKIHDSLRSFLVTHRVFTYWLDARKFWSSLSQGWLSERCLLKRILANFPPGSPHLGWFVDEYFGVRLTSHRALLTFASDYCTNLEIWSSLSPQVTSSGVKDEPEDIHEKQGKTDTTYLSFTISDGDNLQYCQHFLLRQWNNPARGSLPLGWTISPALQEVMPNLAEFYRKTATRNDEFIAAPSGLGYIFPSLWPRAYRENFLALTGKHMQAMHISLLLVLDRTLFSLKFLNPSLQELFAKRLKTYGLRGIVSGWGSPLPSWRQRAGLPIYQNLGMAQNPQRTLFLIEQAAKRGTRFINVCIYTWSISPSDLQDIVKQLGDGFTVVTPGELLELLNTDAKHKASR
jgi:hypothetical protein